MPSKHELEVINQSGSRTEAERRGDRITDAAITFETIPDAEFQARNLNPAQFTPKPRPKGRSLIT